MVPYVDIIGLCHRVEILCESYVRQPRRICDVAALPFQAHANYGTWPIDFAYKYKILP